ncbi:Hypothetical predicted protein [Lecanosticta acicola]|uniref:Uncharacterized protein n=1 Tax=Lecanosticta acicola TaxID=111012 RepID=A0AAI8YVF2_9PEZI|nr:Hypothetical predicted protein [Lecanosticta acicola]
MRIASTRQAVLLCAFLGCLPRLSFGLPTFDDTTSINAITPLHKDERSVWYDISSGVVQNTQRDHDWPFTSDDDDDIAIAARGWFPKPEVPEVPHAPPIVPEHPFPGPAPRPGPAGSGTGTGASEPARPPPPGADPPSEEQLPPRQNPEPESQDKWTPIPSTAAPGISAKLGGPPRPMDDYQRDGRNQMAMYQNTIKQNTPDTAVVEDKAQLANHGPQKAFLDVTRNENYYITGQQLGLADPYIKLLMANFRPSELGFSFEIKDPKREAYQLRAVWSADANVKNFINRGTYDPLGNFIMYQDAFRTNERAPADERVPLGEMGLQLYQQALSTTQRTTGNLKAAFLMNIQNKGFWAITIQNYNDLRTPLDKVLTFKSGTPQFERYMGSDNLKSKFYAFANHHWAIGNKIPDQIIVVPKQAMKTDATIGQSPQLIAVVIFRDA